MPDLNKRHKDYLDLEIERQKAKALRMREEWEEKKKREAETQAIPVSSKPSSLRFSTIYLPDPEDVAKYEREQQEKERQMEEEDKRNQMMDRFDIRAAFFAFVWVVFLTIIGIAAAKHFTDLFEDFSEPGLWVLVFIVTTVTVVIFYQEIQEYIVGKQFVAWKLSKGYVAEGESITELKNAKKRLVKSMAIVSIIYYAMYLITIFVIGLIFFVLLARNGVFRFKR